MLARRMRGQRASVHRPLALRTCGLCVLRSITCVRAHVRGCTAAQRAEQCARVACGTRRPVGGHRPTGYNATGARPPAAPLLFWLEGWPFPRQGGEAFAPSE